MLHVMLFEFAPRSGNRICELIIREYRRKRTIEINQVSDLSVSLAFDLPTGEQAKYRVWFHAGHWAEIWVKADGDSDMDLHVDAVGPANDAGLESFTRVADDTSRDRNCYVFFEVSETSVYELIVSNERVVEYDEFGLGTPADRNAPNSGTVEFRERTDRPDPPIEINQGP